MKSERSTFLTFTDNEVKDALIAYAKKKKGWADFLRRQQNITCNDNESLEIWELIEDEEG